MAALTTTFAIASYGTYPNPGSSPSLETRAILAVSYGLLGTAPESVEGGGGPFRLGLQLTLD